MCSAKLSSQAGSESDLMKCSINSFNIKIKIFEMFEFREILNLDVQTGSYPFLKYGSGTATLH